MVGLDWIEQQEAQLLLGWPTHGAKIINLLDFHFLDLGMTPSRSSKVKFVCGF
jgi:hypothetical protein